MTIVVETPPTPHVLALEHSRALRVLLRAALPEQPSTLALRDTTWGGVACNSVESIDVGTDGELRLEASPPGSAAIIEDPAAWTDSVFTATVGERGRLGIDRGASYVTREQFSTTSGVTITARVQGWAWHVDDADDSGIKIWAAHLRFAVDKPPVMLWWPHGNLRLVDGEDVRWGWRFATPAGLVFLVPDADRARWIVAFEACGSRPTTAHVSIVLAALGFVFGEPLGIGLLWAVLEDRVGASVARLHLVDVSCESRQAPALAVSTDATWVAEFVDKTLDFLVARPDSPLLVALHLYLASVHGYVDSQFLHAWIGTETLANWAIKTKTLRDGGQPRIADHDAWLAWVRAHESEIRALALPGMEQQLVDRVRGAEIERPTPVQRAFRGEAIAWTAEMEDAEKARHGVAHEGSLLGGRPRNWERDGERVGLARTMLAAMVAKVIGYTGPIADRARTSAAITHDDEPSWWTAAPLTRAITYEM